MVKKKYDLEERTAQARKKNFQVNFNDSILLFDN